MSGRQEESQPRRIDRHAGIDDGRCVDAAVESACVTLAARCIEPIMTGTMAPPPLLPVSIPAARASSRGEDALDCSRRTRSGSLRSTRSDASAAAAIAGGRPTEKTKPGAAYLSTSIRVLCPAMNPPHDASDLLSVPIKRSILAGSTLKCSTTPRPFAPRTPSACASSIIQPRPIALLDLDQPRQVRYVALCGIASLDHDQGVA